MSDTKDRPQPPALRSFQPITKVKNLQELWDHPGLKSRMEAILPRHLNAERMLRTLINAGLKTPNLAKVDPLSMLGVAMTLAYLGLEPNTPLQQVHLIPFDVTKWNPATRKRDYVRTDANLIVGYQGYVELIARGGHVKDVDCEVIWAGDDWENERGTNRHFRHIEKYHPRKPGQEPDFAYMHARLINGGEHVEILTAADVHHSRSLSQGYRSAMYAHDDAVKAGKLPERDSRYADAPWIKHPIPMWKKTALRSGQKWLPKSAELATAISLDEAGDEGRVRFSQVIEGEAVSEGAWEVPADQVETDDTPEDQRPSISPPQTQVQVKTPEPEQPQRAAQRKAPAKRAAPITDEPPADFDNNAPPDDRWEPPGPSTQASPPANDAPADPIPSSSPSGRTEQSAKAPTPEEANKGPASSGVAPFEAWLLDEHGDPTKDEPEHDAMAFAVALASLIRTRPDQRINLLQQNLDGIDAAMALDDIAVTNILTSLQREVIEPAQTEPPAEEEPAGVMVVQLPMERGKLNLAEYMKLFKAAVLTITPETWTDWIELNRHEMVKAPPSTASLLIKALAERAKVIGTVLPPDLGPSLLQRGAPAAAPAAAPSQEDQDRRRVDNIKSDVAKMPDIHSLEHFATGIIMKSFGERMQREGKMELIAELKAAFDAKRAELRGKAPA